jgi:hypothetical protein
VAQVAQATTNPHRLELLDLLVQAPRTVEQLADASAMSIANASQQLQRLLALPSATLGLGTAMVYLALLAIVSDAAAPAWRARSLVGIGWAIGVVGGLTFLSGVVVAKTMAKTTPTNGIGIKRILATPTERSIDH